MKNLKAETKLVVTEKHESENPEESKLREPVGIFRKSGLGARTKIATLPIEWCFTSVKLKKEILRDRVDNNNGDLR